MKSEIGLKSNIHSKIALIIVESPLQLICAYEFVAYFQIDYKLVVRLSDSHNNNKQLKYLVNYFNLVNVHYIKILPEKDIYSLINMFKFFIKESLIIYDYYILGNYFSGFIKLFIKTISKKKIILLDDGVATFSIQRKLKEENNPLSLFTMFELDSLDNQTIYINKFDKIRTLKNAKSNNNIDVFIGGKLVDLDIVSLDTYLCILNLAVENSKGQGVVYLPHRDTSESVLKEVKRIKNLKVIYPDCNVEIYLLKKNIKPLNIYSIISTALFSLSIIYPDAKVIAYHPKINKMERTENIEKLYDILRLNANIEVREI